MSGGSGKLAGLRNNVGLTQQQVAARLGTWATVVSRIERGLSEPSVEMVERLARLYHVTPAVVFECVRHSVRSRRKGGAAA